MTCTAKVICDSVPASGGKRLTTVEATYPRDIHAQFLTHRTHSRNAGSSRAIPFEKMIATTVNDPFVPNEWQMEQRGMQGGEALPYVLANWADQIWTGMLHTVAKEATKLRNIGKTYNDMVESQGRPRVPEFEDIRIHKTIPNRALEPWSHITVIMSATEWEGFFLQRCHPEAEIHMQELACAIRDARNLSVPRGLLPGEWHLPYVTGSPDGDLLPNDPILRAKISTARCARVSFLTHDGVPDWAKDIELCNRLREGSGFGHRSPYEHVAKLDSLTNQSGNFRGPWLQFREMTFPPPIKKDENFHSTVAGILGSTFEEPEENAAPQTGCDRQGPITPNRI